MAQNTTAAPIKTPKTISQITADMSIGACYRFYNVYQYPSNNGCTMPFLGTLMFTFERLKMSYPHTHTPLWLLLRNRNKIAV